MIKYVKRKDLDIAKYNACIKNSLQSRVYGFSWYLDIVADNWDALVLDDYTAVMPIPWKSKFGLKYITQPYFCQQLGVFSKKVIDENEIKLFLKKIPYKYLKINLQLNSNNYLATKKKKINYILYLKSTYKELFLNFNSNRKRDLKKAQQLNLIFKTDIAPKEFLNFYLSNDNNYLKYKNILKVVEKFTDSNVENIKYYGIRNRNNNLIAGLLLLDNGKRITYLIPVSSVEAKKNGAATLLLSEIIKKYSKTNYVLDFEGSMIEGVASFYKSFGAEKEVYFHLTRKRI